VQGVQSPDDGEQMNEQDPHGVGMAYEFEVKEQDRWLPIANGEFWFVSLPICAEDFLLRAVPVNVTGHRGPTACSTRAPDLRFGHSRICSGNGRCLDEPTR
jgi:hypothetical protein